MKRKLIHVTFTTTRTCSSSSVHAFRPSARRGLLCKCTGEWERAAGLRVDYVKLLVSLKT